MILIILTFLCILTVNRIHSQIIEFYPVADTIFIAGGCTPPITNVSIGESQTLLDTIKIVPGWNTNIWTSYPEKDEYYDKAYYLVKDSLNIFNYELWIVHQESSFGDPILVPFDSTYEFYAYKFVFKLFVLNENIIIDSLEQNFIAKIGIGIETKNKTCNIPKGYILDQNYPNPFNSKTVIRFEIPFLSFVGISIYNVNGQLVENLKSEVYKPGIYTTTWNANRYNSGIYFIRLSSNKYYLNRKALLLK